VIIGRYGMDEDETFEVSLYQMQSCRGSIFYMWNDTLW